MIALVEQFSDCRMNATEITRRPLKSRNTRWATVIAGWLARKGIPPNAISVVGVGFAAIAGFGLACAGHISAPFHWVLTMLLAIWGMQFRLLCNLFDGMVAIEGGLKTKSGEIFNELPDRFSDAFILIGAAYSVPGVSWNLELGWAAAVLAVITAYTRALGGSMGAGQHFVGPMAKQHRMALMTGACVVAAFRPLWPWAVNAIPITLFLIVVGCLVTIFRRCCRIARSMEEQ
jgi:phosphatidylglycerophosphate synthase